MAIKILVPTPLRQFTGNKDSVLVEGQTVGDALKSLCATYAPLRKHLYADDGKLRSFVNVYVNDEDIRYLQKEATPLAAKDVVSIIPSIAGGSK
ncbi:MAG TPA: ubiquitin-like small modifier protein 1 [Bacteroidota bacterium]|nr:ubiquitin-like small modifier protein 1 [Bacteroidota bacterium]